MRYSQINKFFLLTCKVFTFFIIISSNSSLSFSINTEDIRKQADIRKQQEINLSYFINVLKNDLLNDYSKINIFINAFNKNQIDKYIINALFCNSVILKNKIEIWLLLMSCGADICATSPLLRTNLYFGCLLENYDYISFLLKNGATKIIDLQDKQDGNTPLHIACCKNNLNIVKLLIYYKANQKILNFKEQSPIECTNDQKIITFLKQSCIKEQKNSDYFNEQLNNINEHQKPIQFHAILDHRIISTR